MHMRWSVSTQINIFIIVSFSLRTHTGNAENTVMQALESLNDNQVNDFLSGKSPLNLSVRLGDHLMMIQVSFGCCGMRSVKFSCMCVFSIVASAQYIVAIATEFA